MHSSRFGPTGLLAVAAVDDAPTAVALGAALLGDSGKGGAAAGGRGAETGGAVCAMLALDANTSQKAANDETTVRNMEASRVWTMSHALRRYDQHRNWTEGWAHMNLAAHELPAFKS
jgi:hypothetical protein